MRFLGGIWKRKINGETLDYYPCPYMVGDILITTNGISPKIRYPGTEWEELPEEAYLMIASSKYTVKSTGGENEVTLTINHIPPHTHTLPGAGSGSGQTTLVRANTQVASVQSYSTGGGEPHNNMPKFYAIYGYRRIA